MQPAHPDKNRSQLQKNDQEQSSPHESNRVDPPPIPGKRARPKGVPPSLPVIDEGQRKLVLLASLAAAVLVVLPLLLLFLARPSHQLGDGGLAGEADRSGEGQKDDAEAQNGGEEGIESQEASLPTRDAEGTSTIELESPRSHLVPSQLDPEQGEVQHDHSANDTVNISTDEAAVPSEENHVEDNSQQSDDGNGVRETDPPIEEVKNRNQFFTLDDQSRRKVNWLLSGRSDAKRMALVRKKGGTQGSEQAVHRALQWLAAHQAQDGGWSFDLSDEPCSGRCQNSGQLQMARNGATAMALLPFLGAGQTPQDGEFRENVSRGLTYLIESMDVTPNGGVLVDQGNMYSHGLAAIVLSEAYAMTQNANLKIHAQRSLNYIVYAQHPLGGGWRYTARQSGDTSMVGWQIMALKSGSMAYLEVDPTVFAKAEQFLDSVQTNDGATYGYTDPGNRPATSAIGLLCRMYLGWNKRRSALNQGVRRITDIGPSKVDMYYNYYATQLLFQYTNGKGTMWKKWNTSMRDRLIQLQEKNGHETGSWFMKSTHAKSGGRLYCTSLAALILEVYYRHMPILQESATANVHRR